MFRWLAREGGVPLDDMLRTFNCGLGMAAVVGPEDEAALTQLLRAHGETVWRVGRVVARRPGAPAVTFNDVAPAWPM